MSTFRSMFSSVKYHSLTRPAIVAAQKGIGKGFSALSRFVDRRTGKGKTSTRQKVLMKTRGTASGKGIRQLSKGTAAGLAARKALAKQVRKMPRPLRSRNGKLPTSPTAASVAKKVVRPKAPHASAQAAVNASTTHGQLRRKVTGLAVRKVASFMPGDRASKAVSLRNLRRENPGLLKKKVRKWKNHYSAEAVKHLGKKKA